MSIWKYANPRQFMTTTSRLLAPLGILCVCLLATGLIWGFFFTPDDFRQGSTVKILFIHVPSALMAINAWLMMLVCSIIWVVRRHHVSALAAKAAAPIGLVMTIIALLTGAIWGKPMWGTYWEWDPRLTSFLVLAIFYLGYLALWEAIDNPDAAADLTALLCLVGSVFALLSRYASIFWNQGLHQGATFSLDKEQNISDVFWYPAVISMLGFFTLFILLVLVRTRMEIRRRRLSALISQRISG